MAKLVCAVGLLMTMLAVAGLRVLQWDQTYAVRTDPALVAKISPWFTDIGVVAIGGVGPLGTVNDFGRIIVTLTETCTTEQLITLSQVRDPRMAVAALAALGPGHRRYLWDFCHDLRELQYMSGCMGGTTTLGAFVREVYFPGSEPTPWELLWWKISR